MMGKERRIGRIFKPDGKTLIVPMDHGVSVGPIEGIVDLRETVKELVAGGADAVLMHKGWARSVDARGAGLIVHVSAGTSTGTKPLHKYVVCSVLEALRLGADAVSFHVNVGSETEDEQLEALGAVSDECSAFGVPLVAMMYPRGPKVKSEHDPQSVAHASRIGAELGADVVKTNYTGSVDSFKEVVRSCPVPVVIAGGPKTESVEGLLSMVRDSMLAGCRGVSIGRNVFQHRSPRLMTAAMRKIVHEGSSVEEALSILGEGP
ncbi:MAG: class I fructose-bisphosphate aldolase family protein [Candidatus Brockarchaeota archaeon]|nr:class I fructose-bisphosphate aldolase family protein [Candidatus Brockarchaeota archaeon]